MGMATPPNGRFLIFARILIRLLDKNKKNFLIFLNLLIYNDGKRDLAPGQIKLGLFLSLTINKKNRTPPSN
jgi:hypothetical protein